MEVIGAGVAIGLITAAIIGSWKWISASDKRRAARQAIRERICDHDWEPINQPGDRAVLITADSDWRVKCGARRR